MYLVPPNLCFKTDLMVCAVHGFTGGTDNHVTCKEGDVMRITDIQFRNLTQGFVEVEVNGKKGLVATVCVEPMPYFHGKLTREQAEFLLMEKEAGSYLMRENRHYPGDYTISMKSNQGIHHYRVENKPKMMKIDGKKIFKNIPELVNYYSVHEELESRLKFPVEPVKTFGFDGFNFNTALENIPKIGESELQVINEVGSGEYGKVYKCTYKNILVAKKVIKNQNAIQEFCKEAHVMAQLDHPNLIKLIGVVVKDNNEMSLVSEFMSKGCLLDYLTTRGKMYINMKELMRFSIEICAAMKYLEGKGIVHRDLAASNVLLNEKLTAKLSDFGLAQTVMGESDNNRVRIKWTAPESSKKKEYSNKSDMWSFGILLWEIFSYGRLPYPKLHNNEVPAYLEKGNRLEKPEGCPEEIYNLMKKTWNIEPAKRPNFQEVDVELQTINSDKFKN